MASLSKVSGFIRIRDVVYLLTGVIFVDVTDGSL